MTSQRSLPTRTESTASYWRTATRWLLPTRNPLLKQSVAKFKNRMRKLTCRSWGVSNSYKVEKLNQLIRGWINYFKIGSMKTLCKELDSNIRYRLRMCIWKHWKTPQNRAENLIKLGMNKEDAYSIAYTGARIAHVCSGALNYVITNKRLASFGLVSMLDYYTERCVTC